MPLMHAALLAMMLPPQYPTGKYQPQAISTMNFPTAELHAACLQFELCASI